MTTLKHASWSRLVNTTFVHTQTSDRCVVFSMLHEKSFMASLYFVYDSTECRMNDLRVLWLYVIPVFDPGGKLLHPPFPTLSQSNAQLNRHDLVSWIVFLRAWGRSRVLWNLISFLCCLRFLRLAFVTVFCLVFLSRPYNQKLLHPGEPVKLGKRRANARNVSFRMFLWWPIHIPNSVDKTK